MPVKVKICGITSLEDAKCALDLGADALGFNFYPKSPRYIEAAKAQAIVRSLPAKAWYVGIFVNSSKVEVETIARTAGLDTLQFHGDEPNEFVKQWKSWRTIKAIRVGNKLSKEEINSASEAADYLLFDRFVENSYGGTGQTIDPALLTSIVSHQLLSKSFISGGLNSSNIAQYVSLTNPFAVDVASGVESSPGKKDYQLMESFIKNAKLSASVSR
jgi:phosphoribosylanthranilate isomerase